MKFDKQDLKEKLIVGSITTGIFLPVRLLFYAYVSQYWVGSFGVVSVMAIIMFVLIRKKKLGRFGDLFEKQIAKTSRSKIGKLYVAGLIISIIVFGFTVTFIDLGDGYYHHDRDLFFALVGLGTKDFLQQIDKLHITLPSQDIIIEAQSMVKDDKITFLKSHEANPQFMGALILNTMNQIYRGWVAHFAIVGLVTSLEMLVLFFFYKRAFKLQPAETDH